MGHVASKTFGNFSWKRLRGKNKKPSIVGQKPPRFKLRWIFPVLRVVREETVKYFGNGAKVSTTSDCMFL